MCSFISVWYLITIHSGALSYKSKTLLLIGVSGSGKSTLCSYLMKNGFKLFSDELSLISLEEKLIPLPLGLSIKEGSWKVLEDLEFDLKNLYSHKRFDNQKVKIVTSDNYAQENLSLKNGTIIFPKYIANSQTTFKEIDIIETLQKITNSQYDISNPKSSKIVEQWLRVLDSCDYYTLTYSNLKEAKNKIREIMK